MPGHEECPNANMIVDGLWLGNAESSADRTFLDSNNITDILVAGHLLNSHFPDHKNYLVLKAWDWEVEDLLRFLVTCLKFMNEAISNNRNVLVHCKAGVSRSSTIVISYLMWKNGWNVKKAQKFVRRRRSIISPNSGFQQQLLMLEKALTLPLSDWRTSSLEEIDEVGFRISLLPGIKQYRLCRLSVEKGDEGIETFDYFGKIDEELVSKASGSVYQCSNCSESLFTDLNIIPIEQEVKVLSIQNQMKAAKLVSPCSDVCPYHKSIFVEPMKWILKDDSFLSESTGNIKCPQCELEVGEWNWKRVYRCPTSNCWAGFAPNFQFFKSKVNSGTI